MEMEQARHEPPLAHVPQPHERRQAASAAGLAIVIAALLGAGALACAPTADDSKVPPNVQDPASLRTPAGALELYQSALRLFPNALDQAMLTGAVLTDELAALPTPPNVTGAYTALDSRQNLAGTGDGAFAQLHRIRAQAREARGFLGTYVTDPADTAVARERRGHLYAVEGYAEVLLADLFCSGIPLSTVDFQGDYTVVPGSTTREVYRHALALFDSALALTRAATTDSSAVLQWLAAVGRGRALLALGVYDSAAQAVAAVPTDYRYRVVTSTGRGGSWSMASFVADPDQNTRTSYATAPAVPGVGDHEGQNGLDYRASDDPRTRGIQLGGGLYFHAPYYFPAKYYPVTSAVTLTLADGIEARLIEAEAALQAGDAGTWLTMLNTLRTSGNVTTIDSVADTLGVTQCGDGFGLCGDSPGGDEPWYGQPAGGFHPPAGYTLVDSFTIDPVTPEIYQDCWNNSWYNPCYVSVDAPDLGRTTVYVYTMPPRTYWAAGTGGVDSLPALADPGTPAGRVELMFRERAFWLYLTAHRQGDLRRLARAPYSRDPETLYPTGEYPAVGSYGREVVVPVPEAEQVLNPQYTGCVNLSP